jgi:hypothetical protein
MADVSKAPSGNAEQYIGKEDLYLTYTSGQLRPISVPISNVTWSGSTISFSASFPYTEYVMAGFNHAALTTSNNIASADAVPDTTLAGPALLEVNNAI